MKRIKYVGFYNPIINKGENRNTLLSATNKMDYIISKIIQLENNVEILSPSWTYNNKFYRGKLIQLEENVSVRITPTFPWNKCLKYLSILFCEIWLFLFLLFSTKRNEIVMVYHSLFIMYPLYYAKKIKKFKLVLEVEEIYQDVKEYSKNISKVEYKVFKIADKYIFSTELLNQKLNINNKPYSIIYGTYKVEEDRKSKFNDGKIHVIYAGTFDPKKGGSLAAAAAAAYLPKNYHVHIIGFGSKNDTNMLLNKIDEISKKTEASVTYDGLLSGEEYISFLQKCDIGLSTQIPEAVYNETSFPSKILSYMANGLRVVSIRIRAVEMSDIGQAVFYYEEPSPEAIANVIKSIDILEPYDSRELIRRLDVNFVENIKKLLEG